MATAWHDLRRHPRRARRRPAVRRQRRGTLFARGVGSRLGPGSSRARQPFAGPPRDQGRRSHPRQRSLRTRFVFRRPRPTGARSPLRSAGGFLSPLRNHLSLFRKTQRAFHKRRFATSPPPPLTTPPFPRQPTPSPKPRHLSTASAL